MEIEADIEDFIAVEGIDALDDDSMEASSGLGGSGRLTVEAFFLKDLFFALIFFLDSSRASNSLVVFNISTELS